jgi:hypothetical protein
MKFGGREIILPQFWRFQPKSAVSRVFFQKTINKVKIIYLKKIRLNEGSTKVRTFVWKSFYPKISKWQKVSYQEKSDQEKSDKNYSNFVSL